MFEQLFERPKALALQRTGPLLEERLAYLTHMASQGTARNTQRTIARYPASEDYESRPGVVQWYAPPQALAFFTYRLL